MANVQCPFKSSLGLKQGSILNLYREKIFIYSRGNLDVKLFLTFFVIIIISDKW